LDDAQTYRFTSPFHRRRSRRRRYEWLQGFLNRRHGDAESGSDVRNVHADSDGNSGWPNADALADADLISTTCE
jgi:hypothetical protein